MVHIKKFGNLNYIIIFVYFFTLLDLQSILIFSISPITWRICPYVSNLIQSSQKVSSGCAFLYISTYYRLYSRIHFQTHLNSMRNESIIIITNYYSYYCLCFYLAFQYEGLTHYDVKNVPNTTEEWKFPSFLMSTYDAAVVSWRAMM